MKFNRFPIPFLLLAILALLAALWAGLMRLGWQLHASTPSLALMHGPLMISGFLGVLSIPLERAVAIKQKWMYLTPLLAGLGWLVSVLIPTLDPRANSAHACQFRRCRNPERDDAPRTRPPHRHHVDRNGGMVRRQSALVIRLADLSSRLLLAGFSDSHYRWRTCGVKAASCAPHGINKDYLR